MKQEPKMIYEITPNPWESEYDSVIFSDDGDMVDEVFDTFMQIIETIKPGESTTVTINYREATQDDMDVINGVWEDEDMDLDKEDGQAED